MQQTCRLIIVCGSILVVAFALEATWNRPEVGPEVGPGADENGAVDSEAAQTPWRYTKHGWQDLRDWRNVQAEVDPAPPAIHPLAWALGVLLLALAALIWIGDEVPAERPIVAELRREQLLKLLKS